MRRPVLPERPALESLYVRRAYGYIGTSQAGYVRLGETDSAFSLMQTGVLENYGDGAQFNTDGGIYNSIPTAAAPATFIYSDTSHLYATDKIVYLSPTIAGFSAGVGFEPNSDGLKEGTADCASAASEYGASSPAPACAPIASSPYTQCQLPSQHHRRRLMYSETIDGFATKANLGILNAAPVNYTAIAVSCWPNGYDDMTVYQAGAQTGFGGLTLGANVKWGPVEDGYGFVPKGGRDGSPTSSTPPMPLARILPARASSTARLAWLPGDQRTWPAP